MLKDSQLLFPIRFCIGGLVWYWALKDCPRRLFIFCWFFVCGLLTVFSVIVFLSEKTVDWFFCLFLAQETAVGHLICFAGSCKVVKPLHTWHRFVEGQACLGYLLPRQFLHNCFACDAVFFTGMARLVFRASTNAVVAFAIFTWSGCVQILRRRVIDFGCRFCCSDYFWSSSKLVTLCHQLKMSEDCIVLLR